MRVLVILGAMFLGGCGSFASIEELESQALLTGDWSEVEKREWIIARREARRGIQCPAGYISYCDQRIGNNECTCVDNDVISDVFAGRY